MDPGSIAVSIPIVAIVAVTVLKMTKIKAGTGAMSPEVMERFEALERDVHELHQQLLETQERLDFAERMLAKGREERRIGS